MRFRTTILQSDKTATGIRIPDEIVEALGAGKRPPVRVTINGYTYRSTVAVMGGAYMVGVSADNRAGAGVKGGDEVDVDIELDTAQREVDVPPDFAAALDAEPDARRTFEGLSPQQQGLARVADRRREDRRDARSAASRSRSRPWPRGPGALMSSKSVAEKLLSSRSRASGCRTPAAATSSNHCPRACATSTGRRRQRSRDLRG